MAQQFNINARLNVVPPSNLNAVINAIRGRLGGLNVPINIAITGGGNTALARISTNLNSIKNRSKTAGNALENLGKQAAGAIKRFGSYTLIATGFFTFVRAIRTGFKDAVKFEKELIKIQQVTGKSLQSLRELTTEITNLSKQFGVSSLKLIEASRVLSQAGLTAQQVKVSLDALAKSDLAPTFEDINKTAEGSIAIFRQFGIQANKLESVLGSINSVSGKFAIESGDVIAAVRRTGGAFESAGGNLNEFIGLLTSVRATTRESAESIATGFRTIFTRLQRNRTQNFLEDFGIKLRFTAEEAKKFGKVEGTFVGPFKAIQRLSGALRTLESTDPRFAQITEELGGFRQISKVIPLIKQFGVAQQALNTAQRGSDSLAGDAVKAQVGLGNQIAKVREEFSALIRTVADSSTFKNLVKIFLSLSKSLISVVESISPILPILATLGTLKLGSGLFSVFRGFKSGLKSPQAFASGGVVPGSGHGDTVPAMLTPGEFVIRKNAVKAIGSDTLHSMNNSSGNFNRGGMARFAKGGSVQRFANGGPAKPLTETEFDSLGATDKAQIIREVAGLNGFERRGATVLDGKYKIGKSSSFLTAGANAEGSRQGGVKTASDIVLGGKKGLIQSVFGGLFLRQGAIKGKDNTSSNLKTAFRSEAERDAVKALASQNNFIVSDSSKVKTKFDLRKIEPSSAKDFEDSASTGMSSLIGGLVGHFGQAIGTQPSKDNVNKIVKASGLESVLGHIFENFVNVAANNLPSSQSQTFDIPGVQSRTKVLSRLFGEIPSSVQFADIKLTANSDQTTGENSLMSKAASTSIRNPSSLIHFAGKGAKGESTKSGIASGPILRAEGGSTPIAAADTVPALLTPGEFVINKNAAKKIGIGSLNKLNRADKIRGFNKGGSVGRVQKFASGGGVGGTALVGAALIIPQLLGSLGGLGEALGPLVSTISSSVISFSLFKQGIDSFSGLSATKDQIKQLGDDLEDLGKEAVAAQKEFDSVQTKLNAAKARQKAGDPNAAAEAREFQDQLKALGDKQREIGEEQAERAKQVKELEQSTKGLEKFNGIVAGASSALIALGGQLKKRADAELELIRENRGSRSKFLARSRQAGAASTGGAGLGGGAAIGTIIAQRAGVGLVKGGAIGAALGLTIGAIHGYTKAAKEAESELRGVDIANTVSELNSRLAAVASGDSLASTNIASVRSNVIGLRNNLRTTSDPNNRQDILGGIEGSLNGLDTFLVSVAQSSDSLTEFKNLVGGDVVDFFSTFNKQTASEFDARFKEIITDAQALISINTDLIESQRQLEAKFRSQTALLDSINNAAVSASRFDGVINALSTKAVVLDNKFDVFAKSLGNIADTGEFDLQLSRAASQFGSIGDALQGDIQQISKALGGLPDIFISLRESDPFGQTGNFADNAQKKLEELLGVKKGKSNFVVDAIIAQINAIIGADSKDTEILKAIRNDLSGTVSNIAKELQRFAEPLAEANKVATQQLQTYANNLAQSALLQGKIVISQNKIEDARQTGISFRNKINNRPDDIRDSLNRDNRRQANILGSSGGRVNDVASIFDALSASQSKLISLNDQLSNADKLSIDQKRQLISSIQAEKTNVDSLTKGLGFLADTTKRASALQSELTRLEKDRSTKFDVAAEFAFAGPGERRNLERTIGLSTRATKDGNLKNIPAQFRSDIKSFLERIGDTKLTGLGGLSGTEALKRITEGEVGVIGGTTRRGVKETGVIKEIDAINKRGLEASKALTASLVNANDKFLKNINASFDTFLSKLEANLSGKITNILEERRRTVATDIGINDSILAQASKIQTLSGGVDPKIVQANAELIKTANDAATKSANIASGLSELVSVFNTKVDTDFGEVRKIRPVLDTFDIAGTAEANKNITTGFGGRAPAFNQAGIDQLVKNLRAGLAGSTGDADFAKNFATKFQDNFLGDTSFKRDGEDVFSVFKVEQSLQDLFDQEANRLRNQSRIDQGDFTEISKNVGGEKFALKIVDNFVDIQEALSKVPKNLNVEGIKVETEKLRLQFKALNDAFPQGKAALALQRNSGGPVPGIGNTDTVPAMLTPGEFVLNKGATRAIGLANLHRVNNKGKLHRQTGGSVTASSSGGGGTGVTISIDSASLSRLNQSMQTFANNVDSLTNALAQFPSEITLTGRHVVEVIHNGAQVFQTLTPSLQALVQSAVKEGLNNMLKDKFPEAGQVL